MKANSAPASASRRSACAGLAALAAILFPAAPGLAAVPPSQQAYVKASNTGTNDSFGGVVAIDGNTMVVGSPGEDSSATGSTAATTTTARTPARLTSVYAAGPDGLSKPI